MYYVDLNFNACDITVKPRIDRSNLENLIFKVGQCVMIDVDVIGEPPPQIVWTFQDKVLCLRFIKQKYKR